MWGGGRALQVRDEWARYFRQLGWLGCDEVRRQRECLEQDSPPTSAPPRSYFFFFSAAENLEKQKEGGIWEDAEITGREGGEIGGKDVGIDEVGGSVNSSHAGLDGWGGRGNGAGGRWLEAKKADCVVRRRDARDAAATTEAALVGTPAYHMPPAYDMPPAVAAEGCCALVDEMAVEGGGDARIVNADELLAMLTSLGAPGTEGGEGGGIDASLAATLGGDKDRERVSVGLIGFPNVGKSSLVNALSFGKVSTPSLSPHPQPFVCPLAFSFCLFSLTLIGSGKRTCFSVVVQPLCCRFRLGVLHWVSCTWRHACCLCFGNRSALRCLKRLGT